MACRFSIFPCGDGVRKGLGQRHQLRSGALRLQDLPQFVAVDHFLLDQDLSDRLQGLPPALQDLAHFLRGVVDDLAHLLIDLVSGLLTVGAIVLGSCPIEE